MAEAKLVRSGHSRGEPQLYSTVFWDLLTWQTEPDALMDQVPAPTPLCPDCSVISVS